MTTLDVVVIVGCGGMGLALARRLGVGRQLFLGDFSDSILVAAQEALTDEGHFVQTMRVDVSDYASACALANAAAAAGSIRVVAQTAGIGPTAGSAQRVYEIDLVGTANVIEAFLPVAQPGTSLVCVSSMAGHMGTGLPAELERHLAKAPPAELLNHPSLTIDTSDPAGPGRSYGVSKRGNILRVQAAALAWGKKGARVNSVSPGVISTAAGRQEILGPAGKYVQASPAGRVGTPQDVVNAVAFLAGPESSFITGSDILVDGGVVSSMRWRDTAESR